MAQAMVSTPDVAKDLFSGLWDQNTELYQAYQNLGEQSAAGAAPSFNVLTTSYIPVTKSYLSVPTTAYIPFSTQHSAAATPPVYMAPAQRYSPDPAAPRYSPASCSSSTCSDKSEHVDKSVPLPAATTSEYTKLALLLISQSQKKKYSREEEEKRRVRRERNKVAATKCRIKRRAHSTNIGSQYNEVVATQKQLEQEIGCLQREKEELKSLLETHYCKKTFHSPSSPLPPPYEPPTTQPPPYQSPTSPAMSFGELLFVKSEPDTPSMDIEIDPFN